MKLKFIYDFILLLFAINITDAIVVGVYNNNPQGCHFNDGDSTRGLTGTIYQIGARSMYLKSRLSYFQGGFSTENIAGSFFNSGSLRFTTNTNRATYYGVEFNAYYYVIEETAYFVGMLINFFFYNHELFY